MTVTAMATYGPLDQMDLLNALDGLSGMYPTRAVHEAYEAEVADELPPASKRAVSTQLEEWGYTSVIRHNTKIWAITRTQTARVLADWLHANPDVVTRPRPRRKA